MADKNFKVVAGLDISTPLPVSMGGTGQTSSTGSLNALLPTQTSNSGKYLTTDGTNTSWATITTYSAPTIGSTQITSGSTVTTITGLTLTSPTIDTPSLTLSGTSSTTQGRLAWDQTNRQLDIGDGTVVRTITADDAAATLTNKTLSSGTLTGTLTAGGGVGTNGQFLQSTGTGVQWATASGGSTPINWTLQQSIATTSGSTVTVSGISGANRIRILFNNISTTNASSEISLRINGDTTSVYFQSILYIQNNSTYNAANLSAVNFTDTSLVLGQMAATAASVFSGYADITGCNSAGSKQVLFAGSGGPNGGVFGQLARIGGGYWPGTATVTSVSVVSNVGTFDAGTMSVYVSSS